MKGKTFISFLICIVLAGTSWVLAPSQVEYVGVYYGVGLRMLIGGVFLALYAFARGKTRPILTLKHLGLLFLYGVFLYGANYYLCYSAVEYVHSGFVSLVVSAMIIPNIILGYFFLGNRVDLKGVAGALLALLGLGFVFFSEISGLQFSNDALIGFLLSFASMFLSALGTVIGGRIIKEVGGLFWIVSIGMILGGAVNIGLGILVGDEISAVLDYKFWVPLLYLGVVVMSYVMVVYMDIVQRYGGEKASYIWIYAPLVALNMSHFFEGMLWSKHVIIGTGLVVSGSLVSLFRRSKDLNSKGDYDENSK